MELERLCYFRLGSTEENAGYQLAARSDGITQAMAREFGQAVSRVGNIPKGSAEGIIFSADKVYITHVVMSSDTSGRPVPLSSALAASGKQWRGLLRRNPSWLLTLERSVFFESKPAGARPGAPARIPPYTGSNSTAAEPTLDTLLKSVGMDREKLSELLHALYHCIFSSTEETLFISLPPELNNPEGACRMMACLYMSMPAFITAELSYMIGAPLPAQIVFGESDERYVYPNYVDFFPSEANRYTQRTKYLRVTSGLEFLDDLVSACVHDDSRQILQEMDAFMEELQPFGTSGSFIEKAARERLAYLVSAAWLHASGIAARGEEKAYFCPGSDTAAHTMLSLIRVLKPGDQPRVEGLLALLLDCYNERPLHEGPSNNGYTLQKDLVEKELARTKRIFSNWGSPYEQAYARYLCGSPNTPEGKKRRNASIKAFMAGDTPEDIHMLSCLICSGSAVAEYDANTWLQLRDRYRPLNDGGKLLQAKQDMDRALHSAFAELPVAQQQDLLCGMVAKGSGDLAKEFLHQQRETLYLLDDTRATEIIQTLLQMTYCEKDAVQRALLDTDSRFCTLSVYHRADLLCALFGFSAFPFEVTAEIFEQPVFMELPDQEAAKAYNVYFANAVNRDQVISILSESSRLKTFTAQQYTYALEGIMCNPKLHRDVGLIGGVFSWKRVAELGSENCCRLLEVYYRAGDGIDYSSLLKTTAGKELGTSQIERVTEIAVDCLASEKLPALLNDDTLVSRMSEQGKYELLEHAMRRTSSAQHSALAELPIFEQLDASRKLSLLATFREKALVKYVLTDPSVQSALLNGQLKLDAKLHGLCDEYYLSTKSDDSATQFYDRYLCEVRFNPDRAQAKNELSGLAKNSSAVPSLFFSRLLRDPNVSEKWTELADWYMVSYNLPQVKCSLQDNLKTLQTFQNQRLSGSASAFQKQLERQIRGSFKSAPDPETYLLDIEKLCNGALNSESLRDGYWDSIEADDLALEKSSFYIEHKPQRKNLQDKQRAFVCVSEAYRKLQNKEVPSSDESWCLYRFVLDGRLCVPGKAEIGRIREEKRQNAYGKVLPLLTYLRDERPTVLAKSPNLTTLALFGKRELNRGDIKKLLKWADNHGIKLDKSWGSKASALKTSELNEYFNDALNPGINPAIIVIPAVILLLTAACVFLFLFRPRMELKQISGTYDAQLSDGYPVQLSVELKKDKSYSIKETLLTEPYTGESNFSFKGSYSYSGGFWNVFKKRTAVWNIRMEYPAEPENKDALSLFWPDADVMDWILKDGLLTTNNQAEPKPFAMPITDPDYIRGKSFTYTGPGTVSAPEESPEALESTSDVDTVIPYDSGTDQTSAGEADKKDVTSTNSDSEIVDTQSEDITWTIQFSLDVPSANAHRAWQEQDNWPAPALREGYVKEAEQLEEEPIAEEPYEGTATLRANDSSVDLRWRFIDDKLMTFVGADRLGSNKLPACFSLDEHGVFRCTWELTVEKFNRNIALMTPVEADSVNNPETAEQSAEASDGVRPEDEQNRVASPEASFS